MRTSRVSRQTARVAAALSPTKPTNGTPRRSLRGFVNEDASQDLKLEGDASDSDLSSPPSSPETPQKKAPGKRKHGSNDTGVKAETPRRSSRKAPKLEQDDGEEKEKVKKSKKQPAKRISGPNGEHKEAPPPNWQEMYDLTAEMRKRVLAPVDTMGCESLADASRSPLDQRLQTLIALMLSSQTKDTVTAAAIKTLQSNLPGGFNLEALRAVEAGTLNELIGKVGFHNNKTRYIKATADILASDFGGDIPDTIEGLCSLPGVGPKMAYLTMSAAWGRDEGIGVDVHVHRITNLWGWHRTTTPEGTRRELESWLPREKWHGINHLLVGFGQTICLPVGRKCGECELGGRGLCPSAVKGSPVKKKVRRKVEVELDGGVKEEEVKVEEVKVEMDDVGIKVEADVDGKGAVEMQSAVGAPVAGLNDAG